MNKEVFYQVTSGNKTLPVYDVDAHNRIAAATNDLDGLSGKVTALSGKHEALDDKVDAIDENLNELSGKFETLSGNFDNLTDAVDEIDRDLDALSAKYEAHADDDVIHVSQSDRDRWDEVTKMVYSSAFENYKQDVTQEFENTSAWANTTFQPVGNYVSASTFQAYREETSAALGTKLNIADTIDWDKIPYSGGYAIEINDHVIRVVDDLFVTQTELEDELKNYYTSAYINEHYYTSEEVDEKIANFGGFQVVPLGSDGKPNPPEAPKHNIIYLTKTGTTQKDPYEEWIFNEQNVWDCIGEMSVPLDNYYTKTEIDELLTQTSGYASAMAQEALEDAEDYVDEALTHYHNTTVVAGDGVVVNSATDPQTHDVTYTINAEAKPVDIEGENGISAVYDEEAEKWKIGLEDYADASFAKYTSLANTYTGSAAITDYVGPASAGNISLVNDHIVLQPGLYHVDLQTEFTITTADANTYGVVIKTEPTSTELKKEIDATYEHTETVDVSFDIKIANAPSPLDITVNGFKTNETFLIKNLNIHEVISMPVGVQGGGSDYTAGDAISIDASNKINVLYDEGQGLTLDQGKLAIKLGKGLKFDNEGAAEGELTLSDETQETVEEMAQELEGKLTVNMNISDAKEAGSPFYSVGGTCLGASLFTVPLSHKLNTDSEITFFTTQAMSQEFPIMLGLLEYNFNHYHVEDDRIVSTAQTKWIADTGLIWPDTPSVDGYHMNDTGNDVNRKYTFKLQHLIAPSAETITSGGKKYVNEIGPELRSDRAYYLAVLAKGANGKQYFLSDNGYAQNTNSNPYISFNCANMMYVETEGGPSAAMTSWTDAEWSAHADMTMEQVSYWKREGERNEADRPFVMIRNNPTV